MGRIGLPELLVVLLIVVVLFGATKLPQLGRGLGEGIRNFRKGMRSGSTGDDGDADDAPRDAR